VLHTVGGGPTCNMPAWLWRVGRSVIVAQPNEAYSAFQLALRRRFLLVAAICLSLIFHAQAAAAGFEDGMEAYRRGEFSAAFREWEPLAKAGDPQSLHMLGFLYAKGRGVEKDLSQTLIMWRQAAEQGHPPAQFTLGNLYLKGKGVGRDAAEAARWIGKAANAGYGEAQFLLGVLHARGEGVARDVVQAYMWLDLAADQKGLEPGALWDAIAPYLTPEEVLEGNRQINDWNRKPGAVEKK